MSWSPILCFTEHFVIGLELWYTTQALLKHLHVTSLVRLLTGIIGFCGSIYSGYMEHIVCDIDQDITEAKLNSSIDYIVAVSASLLSMITAVLYYYKFGKETLKVKIVDFLMIGILFTIQIYSRSAANVNVNDPYHIQHFYGQWIDFIFGHFLHSIIYGYWIYLSRQGEEITTQEKMNWKNNDSTNININMIRDEKTSAGIDNNNCMDWRYTYHDLESGIHNNSRNRMRCSSTSSSILGTVILILYATIALAIVSLEFIMVNGKIHLLGMCG